MLLQACKSGNEEMGNGKNSPLVEGLDSRR